MNSSSSGAEGSETDNGSHRFILPPRLENHSGVLARIPTGRKRLTARLQREAEGQTDNAVDSGSEVARRAPSFGVRRISPIRAIGDGGVYS